MPYLIVQFSSGSDFWLDVVATLIGALAGGLLTYIIGSFHLGKQLNKDKDRRKTDYIIRNLEYNRDRLMEIKTSVTNIYNSIYHESEYRKLILENEHLVYDEKTNIVLFKDLESLIESYLQLTEKMNSNKDKEVKKVQKEINILLDNGFYSKVRMLNTYEMKLTRLKGRIDKSKLGLEPQTVEIMEAGLEELEDFLKIIDEDLRYVNGRLINEETRL